MLYATSVFYPANAATFGNGNLGSHFTSISLHVSVPVLGSFTQNLTMQTFVAGLAVTLPEEVLITMRRLRPAFLLRVGITVLPCSGGHDRVTVGVPRSTGNRAW